MKYFKTMMGLLLIGLTLSQSAYAAPNFKDKRYALNVYDQRSVASHSESGRLIDSVYVLIYDAGTRTLSTIYADNQRTAKTNPITRSQYATDDGISFWSARSSHDIVIAHSDGSVAKYSGVTPNNSRLELNRTGNDKLLIFPMAFSTGGAEVDTGLDLPYGALVYNAWVEITTTDATETVDMGLLSSETAGDADGFLNDVSVATAGIPARVAYTTGSNEVYLSTFSYGALLGIASLGNDVATDVGGAHMLTHYVTGSNATSVTYSPSTSDTFIGYGYVAFKMGR